MVSQKSVHALFLSLPLLLSKKTKTKKNLGCQVHSSVCLSKEVFITGKWCCFQTGSHIVLGLLRVSGVTRLCPASQLPEQPPPPCGEGAFHPFSGLLFHQENVWTTLCLWGRPGKPCPEPEDSDKEAVMPISGGTQSSYFVLLHLFFAHSLPTGQPWEHSGPFFFPWSPCEWRWQLRR